VFFFSPAVGKGLMKKFDVGNVFIAKKFDICKSLLEKFVRDIVFTTMALKLPGDEFQNL
jgi:hypothetical protein